MTKTKNNNLLSQEQHEIPKESYGIQLICDYQYTRINIDFEVAKKKHPDSIITIKRGTILWQQENIFDIEQVLEVKEEGFHYQFGFGPAYVKIPYSELSFIKLSQYNI